MLSVIGRVRDWQSGRTSLIAQEENQQEIERPQTGGSRIEQAAVEQYGPVPEQRQLGTLGARSSSTSQHPHHPAAPAGDLRLPWSADAGPFGLGTSRRQWCGACALQRAQPAREHYATARSWASAADHWVGIMMICSPRVDLKVMQSNGRWSRRANFWASARACSHADGWAHVAMPATNLRAGQTSRCVIRLMRAGRREASVRWTTCSSARAKGLATRQG